MNIKLDLTTDWKSFWLIMILFIMFVLFINALRDGQINLISLYQYANCSCSPNYIDWKLKDATYYHFNNTNKCCYPSECQEAKNNPKDCKCIYTVECGTYKEMIR